MGRIIDRRRVMGGKAANSFIQFADPAMKALCVQNWGGATGGSTHVIGVDGELTYEQAAAVTSLVSFANNTEITSFEELQYFTKITSIGTYCFYGCSNLQSVVIPNNVTSIGDATFLGCNLRTVTIPDSVVSMGVAVFSTNKNMVYAKISSNITTIPGDTFVYCESLEVVDLSDVLIRVNSSRCFDGCKKLKKIKSTDEDGVLNIPEGVEYLGGSAFSSCYGFTEVIIPSTVTTIEGECFAHCYNVQYVMVKAIVPPVLNGNYAFYNTNNAPIYVPAQSVNDYKSANRWSNYASRIQAIPTT